MLSNLPPNSYHLSVAAQGFRTFERDLIVPVHQIASIVADGELLKITTPRNEGHTISYRLKDLDRSRNLWRTRAWR